MGSGFPAFCELHTNRSWRSAWIVPRTFQFWHLPTKSTRWAILLMRLGGLREKSFHSPQICKRVHCLMGNHRGGLSGRIQLKPHKWDTKWSKMVRLKRQFLVLFKMAFLAYLLVFIVFFVKGRICREQSSIRGDSFVWVQQILTGWRAPTSPKASCWEHCKGANRFLRKGVEHVKLPLPACNLHVHGKVDSFPFIL